MTEKTENSPLILTRLLDAPIEKVWRAWSDPKQIAKWWGPKNFTNPRCEVDFRVGGEMRIEMMDSEGNLYPMTAIFREIDEPNKIVLFNQAFEDGKGNADLEIINTILFEDQTGKTKLTMEARVQKAVGIATEALKGQEQGWSESLDKLHELLT